MGGGEGERGEGRGTLHIRSSWDGEDGLCHPPTGGDEGRIGGPRGKEGESKKWGVYRGAQPSSLIYWIFNKLPPFSSIWGSLSEKRVESERVKGVLCMTFSRTTVCPCSRHSPV